MTIHLFIARVHDGVRSIRVIDDRTYLQEITKLI
jgi:hypothetical protein